MGLEEKRPDLDPKSQIDDLLSKLDKLGLNTPNSPYATEGRQQMRSALERLSRLLKTTE